MPPLPIVVTDVRRRHSLFCEIISHRRLKRISDSVVRTRRKPFRDEQIDRVVIAQCVASRYIMAFDALRQTANVKSSVASSSTIAEFL